MSAPKRLLTTGVVFAAAPNFQHAGFFGVLAIFTTILAIWCCRAVAGGVLAFCSLIVCHNYFAFR